METGCVLHGVQTERDHGNHTIKTCRQVEEGPGWLKATWFDFQRTGAQLSPEAETGRPPRTGPCYVSDGGLQTTAAEMRLSPFWGHGHLAVPAAQPSLARLCFRNRRINLPSSKGITSANGDTVSSKVKSYDTDHLYHTAGGKGLTITP